MKNFCFFYNIMCERNDSVPTVNVVNNQVCMLIDFAIKYPPIEWSLYNDVLWGRVNNTYVMFCAHYILSSFGKEKIKEYRNLLTLQEYNIDFIKPYFNFINTSTKNVDEKVFNKLKQLNLDTLLQTCDVNRNGFVMDRYYKGDVHDKGPVISYLYELVSPELESGLLSKPFRDIYNSYIRRISC